MITIYEGIVTGTTTNGGIQEVFVARAPDHACRCDECKALDEVDEKVIALCKRYLSGGIDYKELRHQQVFLLSELTPRQFAIHKHFDAGAIGLVDAVELIMADFSEGDILEFHSVASGELGAPFTEREFRCKLDGLIFGYETRMRTVHQWKREVRS